MRRFTCLLLTLAMLLSLTACGGTAEETPEPSVPSAEESVPGTPAGNTETTPGSEESPKIEVIKEPEPYDIYDPTVMPEGGIRDGVTYVEYNGVVEHLFFHPVIAYPELAFDGDRQEKGLDDWMVTVGEFNKILNRSDANPILF